MVKFEAEWSGCYPCFCSGKWTIKKNGVDVSNYIPNNLKESPMNTSGKYKRWHFEDWMEVWETYEDGLECEDWIKENKWISKICDNHDEMVELFRELQSEDWRHGSCGGCI